MEGADPNALIALRQWVIKECRSPLVGSHVVMGEPLAPETVRQFLADVDVLEKRLRITRNCNGVGFGNTARLVNAYKAMKVPFLSGWEETELDVRKKLAARLYDRQELVKSEGGPYIGPEELWLLVMHGGDAGISKARPLLLASADEDEAKGHTAVAAYNRWLATGELAEGTRVSLLHRFSSASAPLEQGPVKTSEKLDRQIGAFMKGEIAGEVVEKSFRQWFGYCYHAESPSNFHAKQPHIIAHNLLFEPGPPAATLALVKACLAPFKPARVKARREFVLDVEPIAETFAMFRARAEALLG